MSTFAQPGKYLTFLVGKEEYGIPILKAKEIIKMMDITSIPKTPQFMRGVINLRGKIIPIIDLRLKFRLEAKEYTERTCIIVVELLLNHAKRQMGIIVDTVSEVINIPQNDLEPPPQYGTQLETGYLTGMGKVKDKVVLLLDIEKAFSDEEFVTK
ncbi:MAG: chemotaxis protein CheW [Firmicutes bacterium]|nr:chemotaxis protein CheW [Bacillota bacterium]